jgi:ABC-type multidrug transport system fused ATPase/permease subunit
LISLFRRALALLDQRRRRLFTLVGGLALGVSGLEALSAVLVLVLMKLIVEPGRVPEVPLVGSLSRLFPGATPHQLIVVFGVVFVVFFVMRAAAFLTQQYVSTRVTQNAGVHLSHRLLYGYLLAPYEFHLRRNSAESMRNVYDNTQQLVSGVYLPLTVLFAESVMVTLMLAVLMITAPLITLLAAGMMGAAVIFSLAVVQPRLKRYGKQRQLGAKAAIQHLQQGLQGLRDVKVAGREETFAALFRRERGRMAHAEYIRATLAYVPRTAVETAFLLFIVLLLLLSITSKTVGGLLSTLGLFAYAGMRLQPSLQKIANSLNTVRYAEPVVDELEHDLSVVDARLRQHDTAPRDASAPLPFTQAVELHDVSFVYAGAGTPALEHIDLRIEPGTSVGIAGPTGGGKSTLLDVVCGLITPTSGRVTVDGMDIAEHTRAWHRSIGVVHQSSFLVDDTIRCNIALGLPDDEIDDVLVAEVVAAAELNAVLDGLEHGVNTPVGERGVRLSGGQRQRIALARALYRRPRLLILDEATSALDNATESRVIANIERVSPGMAIIAVAHRMRTIMSADVVLLLSHGRLAAAGSFDDLRATNAEFAALSA